MQIVLDLNPAERRLLVNALNAVAPTGGGSPVFSLARKIAAALEVDNSSDDDNAQIVNLQTNAVDEWLQGACDFHDGVDAAETIIRESDEG